MNITTYHVDGKTTTKSFEIPSKEVKSSMLSVALRVYEARLHPHLAKTKTRGEVNISTRKIYKQKGTGGARHGAKSAPIFVGGGTAHGPKGVQRTLKVIQKIKAQALGGVMYLAQKQDKIVSISLAGVKKTKEAAALCNHIQKVTPFVKGLLLLSPDNQKIALYFRNLENITLMPFSQVSPLDVYKSDLVILDADLGKEVKKVVKTKVAKIKEVKK